MGESSWRVTPHHSVFVPHGHTNPKLQSSEAPTAIAIAIANRQLHIHTFQEKDGAEETFLNMLNTVGPILLGMRAPIETHFLQAPSELATISSTRVREGDAGPRVRLYRFQHRARTSPPSPSPLRRHMPSATPHHTTIAITFFVSSSCVVARQWPKMAARVALRACARRV